MGMANVRQQVLKELLSNRVKGLLEDNLSQIYKAEALPSELVTLYHAADKSVTNKISREGIRSFRARGISNPLIDDGEMFRDYDTYVWLGRTPEAAAQYAVGYSNKPAIYKVDLSSPKLRRQAVTNPEMEEGAVAVRGMIPSSKITRIAGAGGAAFGISLGLSDEEAEASPIGKVFKVGQRAMGSLSSSSERLAGQELQGKVIREVRHGRGDWRQIVFNDDSVLPVTKDYIHDLSRAVGTQKYTGMLAEKSPEAQLLQAERSMKYHESLARRSRKVPDLPKASRPMVRSQHQSYLRGTQELDPELLPDTVMVTRGSLYYSMPRVYAELLEAKGKLKISRSKTDEALLKPYRKKGEETLP